MCPVWLDSAENMAADWRQLLHRHPPPMVRPIRLRFRRRIRDEQKFPSLEALRVQLEKDRDAVSSAVHISPGA